MFGGVSIHGRVTSACIAVGRGGLLDSLAGSTAVLCPHRRDSHATFGDPATWVYVSPPMNRLLLETSTKSIKLD